MSEIGRLTHELAAKSTLIEQLVQRLEQVIATQNQSVSGGEVSALLRDVVRDKDAYIRFLRQ